MWCKDPGQTGNINVVNEGKVSKPSNISFLLITIIPFIILIYTHYQLGGRVIKYGWDGGTPPHQTLTPLEVFPPPQTPHQENHEAPPQVIGPTPKYISAHKNMGKSPNFEIEPPPDSSEIFKFQKFLKHTSEVHNLRNRKIRKIH